MLRIVNYEEIRGLLLLLPKLADRLERKEAGFPDQAKNWLKAVEKVLANNRMLEAGNVATLRAVLLSAERGIIPQGITFRAKPTARKIRDAVYADVLRRAEELLSGAIRDDGFRIAEAERLGLRLIARAKAKGIIPPQMPEGDHIETIKSIWRAMTADPDIGLGTTSLLGLLGPYDSLIIVDRLLAAA